MTVNSPPYALQASSHSAQLFRQAISTLLASAGGIVAAGDYLVTQNGTPNMSVNVAGGVPGGQIWVPGTTSAGVQGLYYGFNDGTVNLAVAASNPTNPRIDIAVAQVQDAAYTGATNSFQLAIVTGTPAGSPVAPATPASSLVLANIAVAALATTVVTGNITDKRSRVGFSPLLASNLPGYEIGYDQITANVAITANTEAAGTTVISCAAHTFDGSPALAEFFCPSAQTDTSGAQPGSMLAVLLFEGATELGRIAIAQTQVPAGNSTDIQPLTGKLRFTPSVGSHTYTVKAYATSAGASNGLIFAGLGGTNAYVPAFARFTKV